MLAVPLAGRDLTKGAYLLVIAREGRQACAVFLLGGHPRGVRLARTVPEGRRAGASFLLASW